MKQAYILLSLAKIPPKKQVEVINFYGSSEEFWNNWQNNDEILEVLSVEEISSLKDVIIENGVERHLKGLKATNSDVICIDDGEYPELLKQIFDPPTLLYFKGEIKLLKTDCIAIVGSRVCSKYGAEQAEKFAFELSQAGLTIVSGLAEGIDGNAHLGALKAKGKTIAVLAGGLNNIYPAIHTNLAKQILENGGLLLSENPPSYLPKGFNFVQRNRIIAGLSLGVFVPEAGFKSGSLHTVNFANDNGRNIFALPGRVDSKTSVGTNNLIKNMQGCCVCEPADIISQFPEYQLSLNKKTNKVVPKQLTLYEQIIIDALQIEELHFDELAKKCQLDTKTLNSLLTTMQIRGLIKKLAGNFFSI